MNHFFKQGLIACAFAATSCNNPPAQPKQSIADSLLKEVLASHDVAMSKMMKLERLQKEVKHLADSLKKLSPGNLKTIAGYRNQTDGILHSLRYADSMMNKWMEGFKYDSLKNNELQREAYLRNELKKVNQVKEAILNSVQKADSFLAR